MLQFTRASILGNLGALLSGTTFSQGLVAVTLLLTTRQLGPTAYGQYAACLAVAGISAVLYNLGLDHWLLKEGGQNREQLALLAGSVLGLKVGLGLVWWVSLVSMSFILKLEAYPVEVMLWAAFVMWCESLLATTLTVFRAALLNKTIFALEPLADGLWLLATVGLIVGQVKTPATFMQARLAISLLGLGIALVLGVRRIGLQISSTVIKQAWHAAPPYALTEFLGAASARLDVAIVAVMLAGRASGLYASAINLINALFFIPAVVYVVMVPVLSRLFATETARARFMAKRAIGLQTLIGISLAGGVLVFSPLLVKLLGPEFLATAELLSLLSGVLFFKSLSFGMAAILVAQGQVAGRVRVQIVAVSLSVLANILLIPVFGILGVAWVYVLTEGVLLAGYTVLALRPFRLWWRHD